MPALFENCDDVVGVSFGFEIENERRKAEDSQGGGSKDRSFKTGRGAFVQDFCRRTRGITQIIGKLVEKFLDAGRILQRAQAAQLRSRESKRSRARSGDDRSLRDAGRITTRRDDALRIRLRERVRSLASRAPTYRGPLNR